jgi:hypothetical protein
VSGVEPQRVQAQQELRHLPQRVGKHGSSDLGRAVYERHDEER